MLRAGSSLLLSNWGNHNYNQVGHILANQFLKIGQSKYSGILTNSLYWYYFSVCSHLFFRPKDSGFHTMWRWIGQNFSTEHNSQFSSKKCIQSCIQFVIKLTIDNTAFSSKWNAQRKFDSIPEFEQIEFCVPRVNSRILLSKFNRVISTIFGSLRTQRTIIHSARWIWYK